MKVFYQSTEALWLLFNLFASAFALKEENVFAWMYMSTHTQGETISFAVTKCSRMRAYIPSLPVRVPTGIFTLCAITAVPKHCLSSFGASFSPCHLLPYNSAMVMMLIFMFPSRAQIEGIIGALPMVKPMIG